MRLPRYRPPASVPDARGPGFSAWLLGQLRAIGDDLSGSGGRDVDSTIRQERVDLPAGGTRRVSPTSSGTAVVLEAPSSDNAGDRATLIIESPRGTVTVTSSPHTASDGKVTASLINGARQATFTRSGAVVFYSNGVNGWKTHAETPGETPTPTDSTLDEALEAEVLLGAAHDSFPNGRVATDSTEIDAATTASGLISWALRTASVALTRLATQAADTLVANVTNAAASPTAHAFSTLAGRHLTYQGSGVVDVERDISYLDLVDDFVGGNLTSGSIGELGWSATLTGTATVTRLTGVDNHPGILRLTAAANGDRVALHFGPLSSDTPIDNFDSEYYEFLVRTSSMATGATNARSVTFGAGVNIDTSQLGTDSVFFIAFPGSTGVLGSATNNWVACVRVGSVNSATDTSNGATGTTNWKRFRIKRIPLTGYEFYIDDMATPVATINAGPTTAFNIGFRVAKADANAGSQTVDVDAFYYRTNSLGTRIGA